MSQEKQEMGPEIAKVRNPEGLQLGELVEVVTVDHREFGKRGTIDKLFDVEVESANKPRASIKIAGEDGEKPKYIFVSLPNLARVQP